MESPEALAFQRIAEVLGQGAYIFHDAASTAPDEVTRARQACDALASVLGMLAMSAQSLAERVECEGIADA